MWVTETNSDLNDIYSDSSQPFTREKAHSYIFYCYSTQLLNVVDATAPIEHCSDAVYGYKVNSTIAQTKCSTMIEIEI